MAEHDFGACYFASGAGMASINQLAPAFGRTGHNSSAPSNGCFNPGVSARTTSFRSGLCVERSAQINSGGRELVTWSGVYMNIGSELDQNMHVPVRSRKCLKFAIGLSALAACAQEAPPDRLLPRITERKQYAEIVCSATVVETRASGSPVRLQGKDRSQRIAVANVDHVFKGTLDRQRIAFKYYGYIPPKGVAEDLDVLTADFRAGTRYIIFLKRMGSGLEVAVRPYQMEIAIAPSAPAGARPNADADVGLANELIYAIQSGITRFPSRYFDWAEELIGKEAVGRVQPFLNSGDPEVRYGAAWWLSFRKLDAPVMEELREAAQGEGVQQGERSGAKERLRDIADGRYVPSNP